MDSKRGPTATSVTFTIFWCFILFKILISLKLDTGMPSVSRSILIFFKATICFVLESLTRLNEKGVNLKSEGWKNLNKWLTIPRHKFLRPLYSISRNLLHLYNYHKTVIRYILLAFLWSSITWYYVSLVLVLSLVVIKKKKRKKIYSLNCRSRNIDWQFHSPVIWTLSSNMLRIFFFNSCGERTSLYAFFYREMLKFTSASVQGHLDLYLKIMLHIAL